MEAHFELLSQDPDIRYYLVRIFTTPVGPVDQETGQPWKPYEAIFLLVVKGDEGEVKGAVSLPKNSLYLIRKHASKLGLKTIVFERWSDGKKKRVTVPIFQRQYD